jgi:hypothetical protein
MFASKRMVSAGAGAGRGRAADAGLEGTTVYDALEKGFDDLADLCDVVADKFVEARDAFNARKRGV